MSRAAFVTLFVAACALAGSGCFLEMMGATAIQGTLQAEQAGMLKRQLDTARGTTAELEFNSGIQAYRAEHGKNPPSLEAMIPDYLARVPVKPDGTPYGYDPATGQLLDTAAPMQSGETDMQKLQRLQAAVTQYWQQTGGYYPPTLQSLVPAYLKDVPKTSGGLDFIYDPRTATVFHPNPQQLAQPMPHGGQANAPRSSGVGGGGLMGETMTGIGIQQELNGMSNAGATGAGTRARQGVGDIRTHSNDQQNQVMDNLGL
ncbi:MAG: hypothetical protein AMXMBFR84_25040 [Candidatus Hydrogenedentota bacterium]